MLDNATGGTVIRILDLETTGLDPETGGVCELAAMDLVYLRDIGRNVWVNDLKEAKFFETLVNPGCPIPPEASGIHHITDKDVVDKPSFLQALEMMEQQLGPCQYYAAHNAPFDSKWVAHAIKSASVVPFVLIPMHELLASWLCTLKIGRDLFGDLANHQLGTMRYALQVPYFDDADVIGNPHDAIADVRVAFGILQRVLQKHEPEKLLQLSNDPACRNPNFKIWFGKHAGLRFSDQVPSDYLSWMIYGTDMEPDKKQTAKFWLEWRNSNPGWAKEKCEFCGEKLEILLSQNDLHPMKTCWACEAAYMDSMEHHTNDKDFYEETDEETGFTVSVKRDENSRRFTISLIQPDVWTDAEIEGSLEEAIIVAQDMLREAKRDA